LLVQIRRMQAQPIVEPLRRTTALDHRWAHKRVLLGPLGCPSLLPATAAEQARLAPPGRRRCAGVLCGPLAFLPLRNRGSKGQAAAPPWTPAAPLQWKPRCCSAPCGGLCHPQGAAAAVSISRRCHHPRASPVAPQRGPRSPGGRRMSRISAPRQCLPASSWRLLSAMAGGAVAPSGSGKPAAAPPCSAAC
jgi:hypothetical protein